MSFELLTERVGDVLVVAVVGELLLGQKLRVASKPLREAGKVRGFVVDLTRCTRVDSAGLGELLMWYSYAAREHKKLLLVGVKESIRGMMRVARVDGILLLARDREAALAEFGA